MLNWLGTRHIAIFTSTLCGIGLALVLSASGVRAVLRMQDWTSYLERHARGVLLGAIALFALARIPRSWLRIASYPALAIATLALLATQIPGLGAEYNGSARWVNLRAVHLGWIEFQPLELAKLAVVLAVAHTLASRADRVREFGVGVALPALVAGVPAALLAIQPDYGGAGLICACAGLLAFVAGARFVHLFAGLVAALCVAVGLSAVRENSSERIGAWLQRIQRDAPFEETLSRDDYQPVHSMACFARGGLVGSGLGASGESRHLPENFTDYILAVAGEQLGLVGVSVILMCFLGLALCSIAVAMRTGDPFGMLLATGAGLLVWLQASVNAAVAMDLLPPKGTTLPLLSYGRSSLVASLAAVGLLLNVARSPGFGHRHTWP